MNEPEDFNLEPRPASEREESARARPAGKRGRAKSGRRARARALLNRKRLQTTAALTQAARRVAKLRAPKCKTCGQRLHRAAEFCPGCGASRSAPAQLSPGNHVKKPLLLRRVLAQVIDRLITLPFFFLHNPKWLWAALAFHLLCDAVTGRGPGKWICRIRVADAKTFAKCVGLRPTLRRVGVAAALAAYGRWETAPFAIAHDFISFLFVWRDRAGQRLEDKLLGTRVLGESVFRKVKRECGACGALAPARARFCPRCGKKPK